MFRIVLSLGFLSLAAITHGQKLSHVKFSGGSTLSSFYFTTDQQVIIKVSEDGKVMEWGTEYERWRYDYQPGKLHPYSDRVFYYGNEADSASRGKVKMIGTTVLTYYNASEVSAKAGKLRSIGNQQLDYYSDFDNTAVRGKLKFAGNISFNYYQSFDNEAFRGKLKSVNTSTIAYYSTFDDKLVQGKLKSIGNQNYTWYTSYETRFSGGLKSGQLSVAVNGVTYIIM